MPTATATAVVDCTVNHGWSHPNEFLPYMPDGWKEYIGNPGTLPGGGGARPLLPGTPYHTPWPDRPGVAFKGTIAPAAPDLETLIQDWLDPNGIDMGLLTFGMARGLATMTNPQFANALVRAANDWTIDRWLDRDPDDRVRAAMLIDEHQPELGAREIERVGTHPKIAAVLIGSGVQGRPAGHPIWDPVYRAAGALELPVLLYAGGDAVNQNLTLPTAGGYPSTYTELRVLAGQKSHADLVSLIAGGAFERHPQLRVILAGGGFTWLPSVMWRFDQVYRGLRVEAPWMQRQPSDYLAERFRFVTYPFDGPADPETLGQLITTYPGLADLLCYGSGFPDGRAVEPAEAERRLGELWTAGVRRDAALGVLRQA